MPSAPKRFEPGGSGKRWQHRDVAHRRLYDWKWEKASRRFRRDNPLCARCKTLGLVRGAQVVDHIVPHRGDEKLFWDESNWCVLCKACHDKLTWAADGAFGRPTMPKPRYMLGEKDTPELLAVIAELEHNPPPRSEAT